MITFYPKTHSVHLRSRTWNQNLKIYRKISHTQNGVSNWNRGGSIGKDVAGASGSAWQWQAHAKSRKRRARSVRVSRRSSGMFNGSTRDLSFPSDAWLHPHAAAAAAAAVEAHNLATLATVARYNRYCGHGLNGGELAQVNSPHPRTLRQPSDLIRAACDPSCPSNVTRQCPSCTIHALYLS